jgi:5-bromo-4-chloroindolyl phosphate hydrolysis protein
MYNFDTNKRRCKMKRVELTEREFEIVKRYKRISEEMREAEKEIKELKMALATDESVELVYDGNVIGRILIVDVKRVDVNSLPPEIKEAYTKISKDRRLIIVGIPIEVQ